MQACMGEIGWWWEQGLFSAVKKLTSKTLSLSLRCAIVQYLPQSPFYNDS